MGVGVVGDVDFEEMGGGMVEEVWVGWEVLGYFDSFVFGLRWWGLERVRWCFIFWIG